MAIVDRFQEQQEMEQLVRQIDDQIARVIGCNRDGTQKERESAKRDLAEIVAANREGLTIYLKPYLDNQAVKDRTITDREQMGDTASTSGWAEWRRIRVAYELF